MEKGTLVEFRLHGDSPDKARQSRLAVVDRPEGKKHWIVVDDRGQPHTLHPRDITYRVIGEAYKPVDIPKFWQAVQPYLDSSSLEVAWEILTEEGESVDPAAMARLLFSDQSAVMCYAAHCLLSEDKLYFKQKGDRYEPRPVAQVAELKHQTTIEAQRQQEWQGFLTRVQQAIEGQQVEWQSSDQIGRAHV